MKFFTFKCSIFWFRGYKERRWSL